MLGFLQTIFGSKNSRFLRTLIPTVEEINALEPNFQALSDAELSAKTVEFRQRLSDGETLDQLLPEAFATVREAAYRVLGERHYDVQLVGGIVLHHGQIAEMRTGEGKTLTSTLPIYLNALAANGVHVVTVNEYLASRDAAWMGRVYEFLGMSVGVLKNMSAPEEKSLAYQSDITYGTNSEFGFDYLRDNMAHSKETQVQRPFSFAIIDEVDSILIDEARTPLIISGPSETPTDLYIRFDDLIKQLPPESYTHDEKDRQVHLTDSGVEFCEEALEIDNLYAVENCEALHHIMQALRAHVLFQRDIHYIVIDDQVKIVDEFTGRISEGRRFSDGQHQALEAKERVKIELETQTLASVTYQNFFRMYPKLSGMTGTADTEALEFRKIYNLGVVVIPTHRPVLRQDFNDVVYKTAAAKEKAIVETIRELHLSNQPVLVGTASITNSERVSQLLTAAEIPHNVLNAKHHAEEAAIIAEAGLPGRVTIATNMAGRGTDIKLTDDSRKAGGLYILGTERHESRRIDNQLRGRSGRQGDPGASKFFLSMEDDLLRIFGGTSVESLMSKMFEKDDDAVEHSMLSSTIERAQKAVEGQNFDIRKHLLEYDDIFNKHRQIIYQQRNQLLTDTNVSGVVDDMLEDLVNTTLASLELLPDSESEQAAEFWQQFLEHLQQVFSVSITLSDELLAEDRSTVRDSLKELLFGRREQIRQLNTIELQQGIDRYFLLDAIDHLWREHLLDIDHLRASVGLRAYNQKKPIDEFKREAYQLFNRMIASIKERTIASVFRAVHLAATEPDEDAPVLSNPVVATQIASEISRNSACICGSGRRYKHCCGSASVSAETGTVPLLQLHQVSDVQQPASVA